MRKQSLFGNKLSVLDRISTKLWLKSDILEMSDLGLLLQYD